MLFLLIVVLFLLNIELYPLTLFFFNLLITRIDLNINKKKNFIIIGQII